MDEKRQNREIKFRAWNAKEQLMSDPFGLIRGTLIWRKKGETVIAFVPEYIIMQYTGLKDKNGKEIYEGDIVVRYKQWEFSTKTKLIAPVWNESREKWRHIIKWEGAGFNLSTPYFKSNFNDLANDYRSGWVAYEVIGNIYENPELSES